MSQTKLITVFGATGNQGGSVVSTFLSAPGWRIRAITRDATSAKAQKLAARGNGSNIEVITANLDDPKTLGPAIAGAVAVFVVSDFWGLLGDAMTNASASSAAASDDEAKKNKPFNVQAAERETRQLCNVIDAVAAAAATAADEGSSNVLERFVLSSLSDASKWSGGKYRNVLHFDAKAAAERYGRERYPDLWREKTSVYQCGFYMGNYFDNLRPVKQQDGSVKFGGNLDPDLELPFTAADEDTGPFVRALVEDNAAGKNLIGYREWTTIRDFVSHFAEATGYRTEIETLPFEKLYSSDPLPDDEGLVKEFAEMFAYWNEFGYEGREDRSLVHPKDLINPPQLPTVREWIAKQDWEKIMAV